MNTQASTGETLTDLDGTVLAPDPNGYDSEGLVASRGGPAATSTATVRILVLPAR